MSKIAIIDYGSGNLHSAHKAVKKAAANVINSGKNFEVILTSNPKDLDEASHIILPGVGSFADCMKGLNAVENMVQALEDNVLKKGKLFLGICVGMQLLAERGLEEGSHRGLGWLKGEVSKIKPADNSLKIPHMGWNEVKISNRDKSEKQNPLMKGLDGEDFYFVHSYSMKTDEENISAKANYAEEITAVINRDNIFGTQIAPQTKQSNLKKRVLNIFIL